MPTPDEFDRHRPALFGLAYRMLGSVMDAEDIVQEAFLRWQNAPAYEIRSPRAYLMTVVSRLCVDQLRLARSQREEYVGAWLPEPLLQSAESDPAQQVELGESISTAFLVLLENLSPLDRAVFLLHEVFNYTFAEIAEIVDRTPEDCRQIGSRARQRLLRNKPRFEVETETLEAVAEQFLRACMGNNMSQLLALLAPDVSLVTDSGGKVKAARNVLVGPDRTSRFLLGVFRRWPAITACITKVNGQPAMVEYFDGQVTSVTSFDVRDGKIRTIYRVLNPDKLKSLARSAAKAAAPAEIHHQRAEIHTDDARIISEHRRDDG